MLQYAGRENNYGYPPGFPTGEAFAGIYME